MAYDITQMRVSMLEADNDGPCPVLRRAGASAVPLNPFFSSKKVLRGPPTNSRARRLSDWPSARKK
jgi:hypothetical protein